MGLLVFFRAKTAGGQLFKACIAGLAGIALYLAATAQPPALELAAIAVLLLAALSTHGFLTSRRAPSLTADCVAHIDKTRREIHVTGGGIDITLHLASRALDVRFVAQPLISSDAPGEFQRHRAGHFDWPLTMTSVESVQKDRPAVAGAETRWHAPTTSFDKHCEIAVRWFHPGRGKRSLIVATGPASRYRALEQAFALFAEWIDHDDEARRRPERGSFTMPSPVQARETRAFDNRPDN